MEIDKNGNWRLYQNTVPEGMIMLGTVRRDVGDTGALALSQRTGEYVQINAGAVRTLPKREIKILLQIV